MKQIAFLIVLAGLCNSASAETRNLRPWDRETVGLTPIGSSTSNRPRTDTTDYGVKFSNGQPALGCRQRTMQVTTPDGRSGPTEVYSCKW